MEIIVKNIKSYKGPGEYIGRKWRGLSASPLANPYEIGKDGTREDVILKYRRWLWDMIRTEDIAVMNELNRLLEVEFYFGKLVLVCHCKPKPCHGDIVRCALIWLRERGE